MIFKFKGKYYRTTERTESIVLIIAFVIVILGTGINYM